MPDQEYDFSHPLVIDASSQIVQAGVATKLGWGEISYSDSAALTGVFQTVQDLLNNLNIKISKIDAVFFCSGPGSTLGLRLTLAFIKTLQWEKKNQLTLFSYNALDIAACMIKQKEQIIQAPFRMGWRVVRVSEKNSPIGKKHILESEDALKKYPDSLHFKDPRKKAPKIAQENIIDYDIKHVHGLTDLISVSTPKKELEVYNPKPPTFKKWSPNLTFLKP